MKIVKCHFVFFTTVLSILCSETVAFGAGRIRKEIVSLKGEMYFIRKDITEVFDKSNQPNISEVEGCGLCVSDNKTSCQPVMDHDGRQNMAKVNSNNLSVKYRSLIKAFVTEKKINRELQDQLRSVEDILSASEIVANKREQEVQRRLQSIEDIISDIRNNTTLMNQARELMDLELQRRLHSVEDTISASNKVANERDRQVQNQLRSMRESIEDLHNNITSFMSVISDRIDEHLPKAETTSVTPDVTSIPIINTNCTTVPDSAVYTLYLQLVMSNVTVYCDQDTDGGGWIVFMRRQDGSVNFDRSWFDYKHGFGSPDGEFWAGNELLHKLTKERPLKLRIDMEDFDGNIAFAMYEKFQVGAEEDKYRLHVHGYSGTAGDSFIDTQKTLSKHAGMQFSTFDSNNDKSGDNCAKHHKGGWWYNSCGEAKLTALYSHDKKRVWPKGIVWYAFKGWFETLKRVEMKIR